MKRLICLVLAAALLCGCSFWEREISQDFFAMDTYMNIKLWGNGAEEAALELQQMINELSTTWSAASERSLLGMLNAGVDVSLTAEQQQILDRAEALSAWTGGAFEPKLRSVSRAWGFYNQAYRVPEAQAVADALQQRQWDLGGVMKGYAGQMAAEFLKTTQVERGILSLGGNIQTYGEKENGEPWRIAIQNPRGGDPIGTLSVYGTMSVVTSGSYQRCFSVDGVNYHHILDPKTGYPAESGLVSVTVICDDGMTADALSTALFVMGLEQGSRFWQEKGGFEAVFVLTDGSIYATAGALLTDCEFEVIHGEN